MPSRTIPLTEAPEAAPFSYTVGGTDGLTPEAVFVAWDGTGAFGDFLPCVSYYDRDGNLLDRAFPDGVTLHPGDTAEVSYRPFKRGGNGGGAALETTDGGTVVNPTTELFIGSGLSLVDAGGGEAVISATPVAEPYAVLPLGGGPYTQSDEIPFLLIGQEASGVTVGSSNFTFQTPGLYEISLFVNVQRSTPLTTNSFLAGEIRFGTPSSTPGGLAESLFWWPTTAPGGNVWTICCAFTGLWRVSTSLTNPYPNTHTPNYACVVADDPAAVLEIENGRVSVRRVAD